VLDYSLYKKCITKVYHRRGTKAKPKEKSEGVSPGVFGELVDDYMPVAQTPNNLGSRTKRKATPVSVLNLRRSKRNSSNNGFKPSTPMTPKSKKKQ
jgi:hypothetical protein